MHILATWVRITFTGKKTKNKQISLQIALFREIKLFSLIAKEKESEPKLTKVTQAVILHSL